ncbi:conserved protein, unknown function [Hepatocystis sp. ex Piliocolobus tephrosceles]|nr:conserved protein, unknown function [Hepatocystis sp. ex Piliocolobus tephrosceles]
MNKIVKLKNYIPCNNFFKSSLLSNMGERKQITQFCEKSKNYINLNYNRLAIYNLNNTKMQNVVDTSCLSLFLNNHILIDNKKKLTEPVSTEQSYKNILRFWNRSPGARYPKKANNGARPDCRSVRKIRKRLKTGK